MGRKFPLGTSLKVAPNFVYTIRCDPKTKQNSAFSVPHPYTLSALSSPAEQIDGSSSDNATRRAARRPERSQTHRQTEVGLAGELRARVIGGVVNVVSDKPHYIQQWQWKLLVFFLAYDKESISNSNLNSRCGSLSNWLRCERKQRTERAKGRKKER